jgi:hypothetical protein
VDEIVGRTKHGELTLDQMAGMMPGMAELMLRLAQRYHVMYYAAKAGNWQLAAYQLSGARKALSTAKLTRPKYQEAIDRFTREFLDPIDSAVRAQDWSRFEQLVQKSIEASDVYHQEWGYAYIRYRMPEHPPNGYAL